MNIWVVKALIQKMISFLPYKNRINYLFQKYVTRGVYLTDELFQDKIEHCANHLRYFEKHKSDMKGFTTLEIGTGWFPIVPIGLYLNGASRVNTVDISSLLNNERLRSTLRKYSEAYQTGKLMKHFPRLDITRLDKLLALEKDVGTRDVIELLKDINIFAVVGDARNLLLDSGSIDLINSNNTFEHIYPDILIDILHEFNRVLAPNGVMSHQIDMSDHFAHMDKNITIYNFLKFSDRQWQLLDNSIQPQNRLRLPDYRQLFDATGFDILTCVSRPGDLEALKSIEPAQKYLQYAVADLAVSHALFVLQHRDKALPGTALIH